MTISEKAWQAQVIDLARTLGYRVAHFRPAMTGKGWRTPVAADGAGFPDLVLVGRKVVFLELKSERGSVADDQAAWLEAIRRAGGEAYVLRPSDLDLLAGILTERRMV